MVALGHKQAFALEDTWPKGGKYTPHDQGIGIGYADIYSTVSCQWIDVTGVPAGDYVVEVQVNEGGKLFDELSLANNLATMNVTLSPQRKVSRWRAW